LNSYLTREATIKGPLAIYISSSLFVSHKCTSKNITPSDCFRTVLRALADIASTLSVQDTDLIGYSDFGDRPPASAETEAILHYEPYLLQAINFKIPIELPFRFLSENVLRYITPEERDRYKKRLFDKCLHFVSTQLSLRFSAEVGAAITVLSIILSSELPRESRAWLQTALQDVSDDDQNALLDYFANNELQIDVR
jgi:hypothetical protein